ncbi:MAG TPA: hypothetical protein VI564_00670 [Candidatus Nanoarchaeia archaeon]|nr:hypothetical protein [Candidatus Nanoarchaeia archaeon]
MGGFMQKHSNLLSQKKTVVVLILAVLLLVVVSLLVFLNREKASFEIQDKCGKLMNLFQHTINDAGECKVRCMSQCESGDFKYKKSGFETSDSGGCNKCRCSCK